MQVLKFAANINSVNKIVPYEGFVYYTCNKSRYLYKCNSMFERVASFRLIGEVIEFAIIASRMFVIHDDDDSLIYMYDMNFHLLSKIDVLDKNEKLYYFSVDITDQNHIYVVSSKFITKLSITGEKKLMHEHHGLLSYFSIFNGCLLEMINGVTVKIYDSKFTLCNTIDISNCASVIFHKSEIHVMHGSIYRKDSSYKVIAKNGNTREITLPGVMKINSFSLSDDEYLYIRTDQGLLVYKDNVIVGMTQGCDGHDIGTISFIDGAHYFRLYDCIYRLVDFNWNDYNSLNVAQRDAIENWLDFRPLSPIHRDIMLLFARELISI